MSTSIVNRPKQIALMLHFVLLTHFVIYYSGEGGLIEHSRELRPGLRPERIYYPEEPLYLMKPRKYDSTVNHLKRMFINKC